MAVVVVMESRLRIEYVWIAAVEVGTEENGGERGGRVEGVVEVRPRPSARALKERERRGRL